jgi:hypothetical protein
MPAACLKDRASAQGRRSGGQHVVHQEQRTGAATAEAGFAEKGSFLVRLPKAAPQVMLPQHRSGPLQQVAPFQAQLGTELLANQGR